jgi:hypothetical protein
MLNKDVVRGGEIPNYSNAWESISMTIYSKNNPPSGFYVYAYIRLDGTPYYIGKGKGSRVLEKHSVGVPTDLSRILILEQNLTEIGALAIERRMIRWYGRKDLGNGILRNKTDGGEGTAGLVQTEEHKSKIGAANRGRVLGSVARANISKGKLGKPLTESHAANISKALTGKQYGKYKPRSGPNKNKGIPRGSPPPHVIENMRKAKLGVPQKRVTCPFCNKEGGLPQMKRHHFDKCKLKDSHDQGL